MANWCKYSAGSYPKYWCKVDNDYKSWSYVQNYCMNGGYKCSNYYISTATENILKNANVLEKEKNDSVIESIKYLRDEYLENNEEYKGLLEIYDYIGPAVASRMEEDNNNIEMMNYTTHENEIFCPLTRISVNYNDVWTLFRASHIKPYKECNYYEKFDPNNWILIVANADALFDKFLITIEDDWTLIYSKYIENDKRLLEELLLTQPLFKGILNDQRRKYLEYHREVFKQKEHERFSA